MNTDLVAVVLVMSATLPATLIPFIYGRVRWWKTLTGRAVMIQSIGLALLIDISVLYKIFGDEYPGRDFVRLGVYVLIVGGEWALMWALLRARRRI